MKKSTKILLQASLFIILGALTFSCNKDNDKLTDTTSGYNGDYNGGGNDPYVPAPTAGFYYTLHASLTVDFEDNSTNATSWLWNFGDGSTSSSKNPSHTYASKGTYAVKLTVKNSNGVSSTATATMIMSVDIEVVNSTSDPYKIYIDDVYKGDLGAGQSYTFEDLIPGERKLYVEQKSGYMLYPTTKTWTIEGIAGKIYTRTISD